MVRFYVHLKVGCCGETWVQEKNTQQKAIADLHTAGYERESILPSESTDRPQINDT